MNWTNWAKAALFSAALLATASAQDKTGFSSTLTGGLSKSEFEKNPSGWTTLTPATADFTNWTRVSIGGPKPSLQSQWFIDPQTHYVVCTGDQGHEWLRYDREYRNFVLHVEWRFAPSRAKRGGGIFVRNSLDGTVWHKAVAADDGGYFLATTPVNGESKLLDLKNERKEARVNEPGSWNVYEITAQGPKLTLWVNGAVTSVVYNLEVFSGYLGLEAAGAKMEFRNIRIKELPSGPSSNVPIH